MDTGTAKLSLAIGVCVAVGAVIGWFGVKVLGVGIALLLLLIWSFAAISLSLYLRGRQTGTWRHRMRRLEGEVSGHRVTLEFDERLFEPNRMRLLVDGDELASDTIMLGTKELDARTRDGADLTVTVRSGWLGTCTAAAVTVEGREARPLVDRTADASAPVGA